MIKSALTLVAFFIWVMPLNAQQLVLRSGDHPTFSRITIPVPVSQKWNVHQTSEGVSLSLSGYFGGFDITDVFVRMQRNRIERIEADQESLLLELNCNCAVAVFRSGELLVVDVGDEGTVLAGTIIKDFREEQSKEVNLFDKKLQLNSASLPWIGYTSRHEIKSSQSETFNTKVFTSTSNEELEFQVKDRKNLLESAQKNLTAEIATAASTGLLENSYQIPITSYLPPINSTKTESRKSEEPPISIVRVSNNIHVTNSMFRESNFEENKSVLIRENICPQEDLLALEAWGIEGRFATQISSARNTLMDSRDRLNIDAALNLVRTYLYFGFGAEALNTLNLDPKLLANHPELQVVSQILDDRIITQPNTLNDFTECTSNVSLWAILSFNQTPIDTIIDTNAAIRALNKLPIHLRKIVAPTLSRSLLQYGDSPMAAAALRSIERSFHKLPSEATIARAELTIKDGKPAEELLKEVIDRNTEKSPEALIKLVEEKFAQNKPLSIETASLVSAYAQELRGTDLGNKLLQIQVIALSQSEQFKEAFEALNLISPLLSSVAKVDLKKMVFEQLIKKADDITFLELTFTHDSHTIRNLPINVRILLVQRLVDLGFVIQAQKILYTIPDRPRMELRQLLAARTALLLQQPFQAQASLIGIEGPEADLALAQAKEMTGSYTQAAEIYSSHNADQQAAQAAWLSDDWRVLTPADTPVFGPTAALLTDPINDSNLGPLAQANRALEESALARSTLDQLLKDPIIGVSSNQ